MTDTLNELADKVSKRWDERQRETTILGNQEALAEYRKKLIEGPSQVPELKSREMTPDECITMLSLRGRHLRSIIGGSDVSFTIEGDDRRLYGILLLYFLGDKRFEGYGDQFSLRKCLMIRGGVGCGKTTAMQLFAGTRSNQPHDFSMIESLADIYEHGYGDGIILPSGYKLPDIIPASKLADMYQKGGTEALSRYLYTQDRSKSRDLVIDDLGQEESSVKHFGNEKNPLEYIMTDRHKMWYDMGIKTHITTNLVQGEEVERLYGPRMRSRFREMFNVIDMTGEDKRR